MCQSVPVYDYSPALQLLDPWMRNHLPRVDETATRRLIQLVAGIFEQHSVLIEMIAEATAFNAAEECSNQTQVRRILRDERISLKTMYYPFIKGLLAEMNPDVLYITIDESSHRGEYQLFQVGLATDGISLPLGFLLYETDDAWADDARDLLSLIDQYLPAACMIVLLADRVHTGEPFLACLDSLGWEYVFRAPKSMYIATSQGWRQLQALRKQKKPGRYLNNVRVWKGGNRTTNVSIYAYARNGFRTVMWYVISSLPACKERFAEYACRWWQECFFKDLKSALFQWERGRVIDPERVEVLLMGVGCAIWAMWILGRGHERIPKRHVPNTPSQCARKSIIKQGLSAFKQSVKNRTKPGHQSQQLSLDDVPTPRVLDYATSFSIS